MGTSQVSLTFVVSKVIKCPGSEPHAIVCTCKVALLLLHCPEYTNYLGAGLHHDVGSGTQLLAVEHIPVRVYAVTVFLKHLQYFCADFSVGLSLLLLEVELW